MECRFKLRVLVQKVEDVLRIAAVLEFNDNANVCCRFISKILDTFELFFMHQVSDRFNERSLVHSEWNRCNDDLRGSCLLFDNLSLASRHYSASAVSICMSYIALTINNTSHWKVGAFYELKEVLSRRIFIAREMHRRVNDFTQIVRREISSHSDSNSKRTVQEQVWHSCRQNCGLRLRTVIVRSRIYSFFIYISKHFTCDSRHLCLGVSGSSRIISVNRSEVSLACDQWVSSRKILR